MLHWAEGRSTAPSVSRAPHTHSPPQALPEQAPLRGRSPWHPRPAPAPGPQPSRRAQLRAGLRCCGPRESPRGHPPCHRHQHGASPRHPWPGSCSRATRVPGPSGDGTCSPSSSPETPAVGGVAGKGRCPQPLSLAGPEAVPAWEGTAVGRDGRGARTKNFHKHA